MKRLLVALIKSYQRLQEIFGSHRLPLLFSAGCRSWPTCSQYTVEVIEQQGVVRGLSRGFIRVLQCNPLFSPTNH